MVSRKSSYREAINEALEQEMERDSSVILIGTDIAGGAGGEGKDDAWGGVLGVTKGLYGKFPGRVLDTPISETGYMGAAVGAATRGLRPVAELMFIDFAGVCLDSMVNQAAKFRYMFGGTAVTPLTVRAMYGAGLRAGAQHSQVLYPIFTHFPGLKVVVPSSPYEAKGLLAQRGVAVAAGDVCDTPEAAQKIADLPEPAAALAIGDLDVDGKPDVAAAVQLPSRLDVFRNTSTPGSFTSSSFASPIVFSTGSNPNGVAIGDLDGDGKPDIAVVTEMNSLLSIYRNTSTPGSFTNSSLAGRVDFSTCYNAWGISISDLDGDGRPDIIFCNQYSFHFYISFFIGLSSFPVFSDRIF